MAFYYSVFETVSGWVGVLGTENGLVASTVPYRTSETAREALGKRAETASLDRELYIGIEKRFQAYYRGEKSQFNDKLDLSAATLFQRTVWTALQKIPYGETCSYQDIAVAIGKPQAPRAVGQAIGRNPLAIIVPCHRVIAADGGLGGYGGGLDVKEALLKLEGALS